MTLFLINIAHEQPTANSYSSQVPRIKMFINTKTDYLIISRLSDLKGPFPFPVHVFFLVVLSSSPVSLRISWFNPALVWWWVPKQVVTTPCEVSPKSSAHQHYY